MQVSYCCECHEISEKMEDIEDDLDKLEWDKEDEREEYHLDLMNEQFELGVEYDDLQAEIAELTLARFDQQEKRKTRINGMLIL